MRDESRQPWRSLPALLAVALVAGFAARVSADEGGPNRSTVPAKATSDADREAAALAFVREHHPEIAALLAQLKAMRPAQYDKAIRELAQVSQSLANLKARDPRRYELGLESWKARSRVDLLTARLAAAGSTAAPEIESQLRQAVEAQLNLEIRQTRFEREQAEARLRRVATNLQRLEVNAAALADSRFQAALKKSQRARRTTDARKAGTNQGPLGTNPNSVPHSQPKSTVKSSSGD